MFSFALFPSLSGFHIHTQTHTRTHTLFRVLFICGNRYSFMFIESLAQFIYKRYVQESQIEKMLVETNKTLNLIDLFVQHVKFGHTYMFMKPNKWDFLDFLDALINIF